MFGGAAHAMHSNNNNSPPSAAAIGVNNNNTVQGILAQARSFLSRNEFFNAVNVTEVLATNVNAGNAIERERMFILRAECFNISKQFAKAEKEARAAVATSGGESPQAQFVLGQALLGQFRIAEAVDAFDVAEALMGSPQPWKYVILPEDEVKSNNNSAAAAQQRAAAAASSSSSGATDGPSPRRERGIELVPRRYRDIGVDDPNLVPENEQVGSPTRRATSPALQQKNNRNKNELSPPLLPPPPVTYDWIGAYNAYKVDANLARKLDQAQSSRLLPRSGLISGLRMLDQIAKKKQFPKFLIVLLRNDTDYELEYQFHTCGSEDSEAYHNSNHHNAGSSNNNNGNNGNGKGGSPPPQSNTQYFVKFPHVIPPGMIGAAIIYCDSWRAKMLTLSAAVCFAMRRTSQQQEAADEREQRKSPQSAAASPNASKSASGAKAATATAATSKPPPSPWVRFSFALSVMNSVTASATVKNNAASAAAAASNDKKEKTDPSKVPNFAAFSFDHQTFAAFAHNSFPTLSYSRFNTSSGFAGTQADVVTAVPAAFLSIVQKPAGLKTQQGSTSRMSPVLVGCIAQYLQPKPLRVAAIVSTTWRTVVSSLPPPRFDDFPYGATMPDYVLPRDVRCSPFTVRNELSSQAIQQFLIRQQQQQLPPQSPSSPAAAAALATAAMPPIAQWSMKREDNGASRAVAFRTRRGDITLLIAASYNRGEDYFVRLPGSTPLGRSLLARVVTTTGFFGKERTANVLWTNPSAPPNEADMTTRVAAKLMHETSGGYAIISVCPTGLQQESSSVADSGATVGNSKCENGHNNSSNNSNNNNNNSRAGWELLTSQTMSRTAQTVVIRDIASKAVVAKVDFTEGTYLLKFYQATDALWCAILAAESIVAF